MITTRLSVLCLMMILFSGCASLRPPTREDVVRREQELNTPSEADWLFRFLYPLSMLGGLAK